MIEPIEGDALKQALVEVRKAYRLLWMFQSRILDICREVSSHFDVVFYQTDFRNKPGRGNINPLTSGSVWAMTPMQEMSLLFLNRESNSDDPANYPRQGDYLLDLRFVADTGRNNFRDSDADPIKFPPPNECGTKLTLYVFINEIDRNEPTQWCDKIWESIDYPPLDTKSTVMNGICGYGYEFDVSTLVDQDSIRSCVQVFKNNVKEKMGVNLIKS